MPPVQDNTIHQQTERFASTLTIDSNKTSSSSNSSGCKDYESVYKKCYPNKNVEEVEVLPPVTVRKPDDSISNNKNKVDASHSKVFCSPEVTDATFLTDSKLLLQSNIG